MKETIYTGGNWRQPFRPGQVPLLAKVYATSKQRLASRLATAVWQRGFGVAFKFLRQLPVSRAGSFEYTIAGESRHISFDARNTQFCSIYEPGYVAGGYEPETTALVDALLSPGDVFYDIGSNWGHISLHVASQPCGVEIHAFEPMPGTFRDLCSVVRQAGLDDQIRCHNLALSNDDSKKFMRAPDAMTSGNAEVSQDSSGVPVTAARLDDLDLPSPSVMKVDVEGHEAEVFDGAARTITNSKPMIIFESWRGDARSAAGDPLGVLQNAGYHFYQPVTLARRNDTYVVEGPTERGSTESTALGLVEFELDQRMLLEEHINILACHDAKRGRIADLFPHRLNTPVRQMCA